MKLISFILLFSSTFVACNAQKANNIPDETPIVCGVPIYKPDHEDSVEILKSLNISFGSKSVYSAPTRHRWPSESTLPVWFLDVTDKSLKKKTLETANGWYPYSGIKFVEATKASDAVIRIAFRKPQSGYWSEIGQKAILFRDTTVATMHLENLDKKNDQEFKRVILHEFGHALGWVHESQHPKSTIQWNKPVAYNYFKERYGYSKDFVDEYIFDEILLSMQTNFDKNSIMILAVPACLTMNHKEIPWPSGLSKKDKTDMSAYYKPKK